MTDTAPLSGENTGGEHGSSRSPLAHSKPVRLAGAALQAAMVRKPDLAARYMQRVTAECGPDGVDIALTAWCDTYVDHALDGVPDDESARTRLRGRFGFVEGNSGRVDGADSDRVPADVRWAAQVIDARATLNEARWRQLLQGVPDDDATRGRYVLTLVTVIADSINAFPRGFANPRARAGWAGPDD